MITISPSPLSVVLVTSGTTSRGTEHKQGHCLNYTHFLLNRHTVKLVVDTIRLTYGTW